MQPESTIYNMECPECHNEINTELSDINVHVDTGDTTEVRITCSNDECDVLFYAFIDNDQWQYRDHGD